MEKTILVVDDKKDIRDLLEYFLTDIGYKTLLCENGEEAVSHISSADIIITDFNMPPGMDGVKLTEIAKRQRPEIPVIIMTGDPEGIPADHLADRVVRKPFEIEQLQKVIADLLQIRTIPGGIS